MTASKTGFVHCEDFEGMTLRSVDDFWRLKETMENRRFLPSGRFTVDGGADFVCDRPMLAYIERSPWLCNEEFENVCLCASGMKTELVDELSARELALLREFRAKRAVQGINLPSASRWSSAPVGLVK